MNVLAEHKFKNDKTISVEHLSRTLQRKHGVNEADTLALCFIEGKDQDADYKQTICMRPDEALIVIKLLAEGLGKLVKRYEIGLSK